MLRWEALQQLGTWLNGDGVFRLHCGFFWGNSMTTIDYILIGAACYLITLQAFITVNKWYYIFLYKVIPLILAGFNVLVAFKVIK
jgi:hypothetical protein